MLLGCVFIGSLFCGDAAISIVEALRNPLSKSAIVFWDLRFPRTLLGLLVGATLGLSGAAMQGFLRNPLAEPGILGVTGGASVGAVAVFYAGLTTNFAYALPVGGMIGALATVLLLYFFAGRRAASQTVILAGVAINILAFAITSLILNVVRNPYAVMDIVFWQMGSLSGRTMQHFLLILPFTLAGWVLLFWNSLALNALSLGEKTATSLGVSIKSLQLRMVLGTALCVGSAVSVCGNIGFVGLVIPHILRPLVKYESKKLLTASAIGGAALLILADIIARVIPTLVELKLGVLTSIVGAPFFIWLIWQMRK